MSQRSKSQRSQGKGKHQNQHIFDDPRNVKRVIHALFVVCALLLVIDVFEYFGLGYHKHVHFEFEKFPGFFAFFGFFLSVGLVLIAKEMRKILSRDEDYYDD